MAVIGELSALTPTHIRLINLKADFGTLLPDKTPDKAKEPPKEAGKESATGEKKEPAKETQKNQPVGKWAISSWMVLFSEIAGRSNHLWQAIS